MTPYTEPEYSERDEPGWLDVAIDWMIPVVIIVGGWAAIIAAVRRWRR